MGPDLGASKFEEKTRFLKLSATSKQMTISQSVNSFLIKFTKNAFNSKSKMIPQLN